MAQPFGYDGLAGLKWVITKRLLGRAGSRCHCRRRSWGGTSYSTLRDSCRTAHSTTAMVVGSPGQRCVTRVSPPPWGIKLQEAMPSLWKRSGPARWGRDVHAVCPGKKQSCEVDRQRCCQPGFSATSTRVLLCCGYRPLRGEAGASFKVESGSIGTRDSTACCLVKFKFAEIGTAAATRRPELTAEV